MHQRLAKGLARISRHLTGEARDRPAIPSLRLLTVLDVGSSTPPLVKRRAPRTVGPLTHFAPPPGEKSGLDKTSKTVWTVFLALGLLYASGCGQSESGDSESRAPTANSGTADQRLRDAAFAGQIAEARRALDQGAGVNAADEENRTALMLAAFNDSADVAKLLLDRGARVDDRDNAGRTALLYAASGPNTKTVQLLLGQGADVDATDNGEGWTALMFAAAEGRAAVVRALLNHGADSSIQDVDAETALDFATDKGHAGVIQALKDGP